MGKKFVNLTGVSIVPASVLLMFLLLACSSLVENAIRSTPDERASEDVSTQDSLPVIKADKPETSDTVKEEPPKVINQRPIDIDGDESLKEILTSAYEALDELESYHFEVAMDVNHKDPRIDIPLMEIDLVVDVDGPDRSRGTLSGTEAFIHSGVVRSISFVTIGDDYYITSPDTGEWTLSNEYVETMETPDEFVELEGIDEDKYNLIGLEDLDGLKTYHIQVDAAQFYMLDSLEEGTIDFWIDEKDRLIRQMTANLEMTGDFGLIENPSITIQYTLSDFGKDFDIEPPKLKELPKNVLLIKQIGAEQQEFIDDLVADKDGNIYVGVVTKTRLRTASRSFSTSSILRKYNAQGEELWYRPLDNFGSSAVSALSLDSKGNVYVGGWTSRHHVEDRTDNFFVRKYDSGGNEIWTALPDHFGYELADLVVDSEGSVYVVGKFRHNVFVRKYDNIGNEVWNREFGLDLKKFKANDWDEATSVSIDAFDNIYVVGELGASILYENDENEGQAFIRKYSPDGIEQWTAEFGGPQQDSVMDSALDAEGNIYITGHTYREDEDDPRRHVPDAFISKFHKDGGEFWTRKFALGYRVNISGITVDSDGTLVISGERRPHSYSRSSARPENFQWAFTPQGQELPAESLNHVLNEDANIHGIEVGDDGSIYLFGQAWSSLQGHIVNGLSDAFFVKFAPR